MGWGAAAECQGCSVAALPFPPAEEAQSPDSHACRFHARCVALHGQSAPVGGVHTRQFSRLALNDGAGHTLRIWLKYIFFSEYCSI